MLEIIDGIGLDPDTEEKWTEEANRWRLPYFDWALPNADIPFIYRHKYIKVQSPVSGEDTLLNPLFRYQLFVDGKHTAMGDTKTLGKLAVIDDPDDPLNPKIKVDDPDQTFLTLPVRPMYLQCVVLTWSAG